MSNLTGDGRLSYHPRLDGLRAVAVFAVFLEHFTYNEFLHAWHPGLIGVRSFFVLSGFLITSILLAQRGTAPAGQLARGFFLRRFLRLAPPVYVALLLALVLGVAGVDRDWPYHVTYLSNVQIALQERWSGAGHLWTLAVEQHFYMLWFPLMIFVPRAYLPQVVVGCMLLAPAFRMLIVFGASPFIDVLLPAQIDGPAAGALVALARQTPALSRVDRVLSNSACLIALLVLVFVLAAPWPEDAQLHSIFAGWVVLPTLVSLAAACLVRQCLEPGRPVLSWLEHPVARHLGKISYGLYVFHYFVPQALFLHVDAIGLMQSATLKILRALIWVSITCVLAELCWRFVEQPMMRLRRGSGRTAARHR